MVKNLPADAGDTRYVGLIPGSGRSPGVENGTLLQYSCLGNLKRKSPEEPGGLRSTGSQKARHDIHTFCKHIV